MESDHRQSEDDGDQERTQTPMHEPRDTSVREELLQKVREERQLDDACTDDDDIDEEHSLTGDLSLAQPVPTEVSG